jgi:hypothetical protein
MVNKLDLIGRDPAKMEVIAITDKVEKRQATKTPDGLDKKRRKNRDAGRDGFTIGSADTQGRPSQAEQQGSCNSRSARSSAIYAKLVQKVGNRHHGRTGPTTSPRSPAPTSTASGHPGQPGQRAGAPGFRPSRLNCATT